MNQITIQLCDGLPECLSHFSWVYDHLHKDRPGYLPWHPQPETLFLLCAISQYRSRKRKGRKENKTDGWSDRKKDHAGRTFKKTEQCNQTANVIIKIQHIPDLIKDIRYMPEMSHNAPNTDTSLSFETEPTRPLFRNKSVVSNYEMFF